MMERKIKLPPQSAAPRRKSSKPIMRKMFEILFYIAKKECQVEIQRVKLARLEGFEPR